MGVGGCAEQMMDVTVGVVATGQPWCWTLNTHRLVGLVVKASASTAEDPGFESRLRRDFFRGRVIPVT